MNKLILRLLLYIAWVVTKDFLYSHGGEVFPEVEELTKLEDEINEYLQSTT